ncbi:MAG: hypothetical protein SW833_05530 [Cyanobacteriota bacterium]|nr:hypothetical protein [Cyanobacteriota bacterium]
MRRRRQRKPIEIEPNLDSFLDILTNTVGVLMFVGLFVTLVTAQAGTLVRTPLASDSTKTPEFFEARNNRVNPIDTTAVVGKASDFINELPPCEEPAISESRSSVLYEYYLQQLNEYQDCLRNRIAQLDNYRAQIPYYNVRVYLDSSSSNFAYAYEPIPEEEGESPPELAKAESNFESAIAQLDPQEDYIAFLVRPDSFEAFRAARKLALSRGFDVGWEPMNVQREIIFGATGRAVGVQ